MAGRDQAWRLDAGPGLAVVDAVRREITVNDRVIDEPYQHSMAGQAFVESRLLAVFQEEILGLRCRRRLDLDDLRAVLDGIKRHAASAASGIRRPRDDEAEKYPAPCVEGCRGASENALFFLVLAGGWIGRIGLTGGVGVINSIGHQAPFACTVKDTRPAGAIEVGKAQPVAEFVHIDAEGIDDRAVAGIGLGHDDAFTDDVAVPEDRREAGAQRVGILTNSAPAVVIQGPDVI